jgi:nitrogen regulatory protein P-II 1
MKMIQAIIRPERFDEVKHALEEKGHFPMTCMEVKGRGEQKGITLEYRGKKVQVDILPKMMIELVTKNEDLNTVITTIRDAACTGKNGDGKIFVLPVDKMVRVRTKEEWI